MEAFNINMVWEGCHHNPKFYLDPEIRGRPANHKRWAYLPSCMHRNSYRVVKKVFETSETAAKKMCELINNLHARCALEEKG